MADVFNDKLIADCVNRMVQAETSTAIATLAAAIIQARGAKTIAEFIDAATDARYILNPGQHKASYDDWRLKNGLPPA